MQEIDLVNVKPDMRKILLIGPSGTGKTHFIGTMPKPIYLFSFDKGYDTLAGTPGIQAGICMDEDRYKPHAYADFKLKFDSLRRGEEYTWPDGRKEKYKTIALDGIGLLSKYIFDHEQRVNNNIDKPGGFSVYGVVKSKLQDVIGQSVLIGEYVVATAWPETSKDDVTGEIFFVPGLVGSMKDEIDAWFNCVFYMAVDKDPVKGTQYKMITVGDRRQKAKIRLPSSIGKAVSAVEVPDFGTLMAKIDGAFKQQTGGGK